MPENKATVRDTDLMSNFKAGFDDGRVMEPGGYNVLVIVNTKIQFGGVLQNMESVVRLMKQWLASQDGKKITFEISPVSAAEKDELPPSDDDVIDAEVVDE